MSQKNLDARKHSPAGTVFGKWLQIEDSFFDGKNVVAKFRCECGKVAINPLTKVRTGRSKSCGCSINIKHGFTRGSGEDGYRVNKLYQAWRGMLNRCYNSNVKCYPNWGGRGIQVCDEWRFGKDGVSAFECFVRSIGEPPSPKHSVERKDVNGNYCPENCIWLHIDLQPRNKRNNRYFTAFGKTQIMEDWAKEFGMNAATIYTRVIKKGMTLEEAVMIPVRKKIKNLQIA